MGKAFCFCKGEIVDCLPGVVLDCNNKRTTKCPLIQEEADLAEQQTKAFEQAVRAHQAHKERKGDKALKSKEVKSEREFCFCVGELVDCPPGVVLDCNTKRTRKCPLSEEKEAAAKATDAKEAKVLEEPADAKTEKKEEKKSSSEGRAFCFCKGEIVDCLPGVVLDCNNKRTRKCPLEKEVEDAAERQTKAFEQAVQAHKAHKERKGDKALKSKEVTGQQEFCFCVGSMVDCPSATVQDCNLKKTTKCKLQE